MWDHNIWMRLWWFGGSVNFYNNCQNRCKTINGHTIQSSVCEFHWFLDYPIRRCYTKYGFISVDCRCYTKGWSKAVVALQNMVSIWINSHRVQATFEHVVLEIRCESIRIAYIYVATPHNRIELYYHKTLSFGVTTEND